MRLNDLPFPVFGDISFRGKCPREEIEQVTFFGQLRREYPDTLALIAMHSRNEGLKKAGQLRSVAQHKAEGMTPGFADIVIAGRQTFLCELKRRDHTQSVWQDGQIEHLTAAHDAGAFSCVALGWEAAWQAMEIWLSGQANN